MTCLSRHNLVYVVLPVEALSIPLQQIGRVYRDDREALTEEDIRLLGSIFDMEKLAQYDPSVSDPIKSGFRQDVSKREMFPVLGCILKSTGEQRREG